MKSHPVPPYWYSYANWHITGSMTMLYGGNGGHADKWTILTNVHYKNITRTLYGGGKQTLRMDSSLLLLGNNLTALNAHMHTLLMLILYELLFYFI